MNHPEYLVRYSKEKAQIKNFCELERFQLAYPDEMINPQLLFSFRRFKNYAINDPLGLSPPEQSTLDKWLPSLKDEEDVNEYDCMEYDHDHDHKNHMCALGISQGPFALTPSHSLACSSCISS